MDEFRENNRLRGALDTTLSGLSGDPYLTRRILRNEEAKLKAAKKLSAGFVFALVILLAAMSVVVAAALNLFETFGQTERRFAEIAPQTVIQTESAAIQSSKAGTVAASITNAYYDGESLLIGYTIQGDISFEPFSPTDEQLAQMNPTDDIPPWLNEKTGDSSLTQAWKAAKQAGTPWGVIRYRAAVSDHACTDEGLDLGPWLETEETSAPNSLSAIRDFDSLPEAAQKRDSLSIRIDVYQSAVWFYFDGQSTYTTSERVNLFPMTATVDRIHRDSAQFMGFETINGSKIRLTIQASEIRLTASVTAANGTLPSISDDSWFDLLLTDETGYAFSPESFVMLDEQTLLFTFEGSGQMPLSLHAELLIVRPSGETESFPISVDING